MIRRPRNWALAIPVLLALSGGAFAGARMALADRYAIGERVTRLEERRVSDSERIQRMDETMKEMNRKIDQLLQRVK